ncbi:MAG: response regulator, partial [Mesorhizobium sp.]
MKMHDVILIDDDPEVLQAYCQTLELEGMTVAAHASVEEGLFGLGSDSTSIIVSDVRMPNHDGFDLVSMTKQIDVE